MHALGALAQFTHGLGSAEKKDAEEGLLSLGEIRIFVLEGVFALRHPRPGLVDEDGELLVTQALHRLLDRVGAETGDRFAVARLVAGREEAVEGQRILVGHGRFLFEETTENARLLEGEEGGFGGRGFGGEIGGFFGHGGGMMWGDWTTSRHEFTRMPVVK